MSVPREVSDLIIVDCWIYHVPQCSLSFSKIKLEERHDDTAETQLIRL